MMRYFAASDLHGFADEAKEALGKATLKFNGRDGKVYEIKERTPRQIWAYLKRYMDSPEAHFEYIPGTQEISPLNGNIYAKFKGKASGSAVTLCIAEYGDYASQLAR